MTDDDLRIAPHRAGYLADGGLATTPWLAPELQRPLLFEGDRMVRLNSLRDLDALAPLLH